MSTRFFKNSLFSKISVFIIIANFILTSCPISAYSESQFPADKLKIRAAEERLDLDELRIKLRLEGLAKRITMPLGELRKGDVPVVGGKNANLGELMHFIGSMIPDGIAVTITGFQKHLQENAVEYKGKRMTLGEYIYARTKDLDYGDEKTRTAAANEIQDAIIDATMPKEVEEEIRREYARLCKYEGIENVAVAVRSSATAEDLPDASFAGQQATFLNVRGIDNVLEATKKCWASLYEQRALFYRHNQNIAEDKAFLSVVIQLMADASKAGVMFTVDPENGSPGITINANVGLGESVVSGEATPDLDKLVYDIETGKPKLWQRNLGEKKVKTIKTAEGTKTVETTTEEQTSFCLTEEQAEKLGYAGQVIEKHYGRHMDIEWVVDTRGQLKIVQARPDTVWSDDPLVLTFNYMQVPEKEAVEAQQEARVKGLKGSPRAGIGPTVIIKNEQIMDASGKKVDKKATSEALSRELAQVQEGDTLVAPMTSPDYVAAMKKAEAIVTDKGGLTCHAAIVARELGKPCVVGTGDATKVLKPGQVVTTDAKLGYVAEKALPLVKVTQVNDFRNYPKLKTKIGLIMSDPDLAALLWKFGNYGSYAGIGLVRDEQFLLTQILKHPQSVIDYDNYYDPNYIPKDWQHDKKWIKEHVIDIDGEAIKELIQGYPSFKAFYVDIKKNGLVKLAKAQAGGQSVKYRASDFKSNEFRNLPLGPEYEPDEANPMAGNRGLYRVLTPEFNEVFRLDLRALRQARNLRSNIDIMFPVVRTAEDIRAAIQIMAEEGLFDGKNKPRIGIMVELASNVFMVEEMYKTLAELAEKYGTTAFMSIGSNDLTQFVLGVDRDSDNMAKYANFWDPAVKKAIEILIKTAKKYNIETGICGEAPSKDPNFAAFLVECGIDSISVAPEAYEQVVKVVEVAEKNLEGQPFDPAIKGWEYPSQLEVKQLPRIAAEKVDASKIIQDLGIHPLIMEEKSDARTQFASMFARRELSKSELEKLDKMDTETRVKFFDMLTSGDPKEIIVERVSNAILEKARVTDASTPIIFTTDTNKSTDYKKLIDGTAFETDDENPYLAFCGLVRVVDPAWGEFFRWQLQGVKKAREASGRKNIGISLNLPTATQNVERALEIMKEEGLVPGQDGLLVGMEIDRGGQALILDQYLDLGLNFISENPEMFLSYVLPMDPGNTYVHIQSRRKQRLMVNGQKIWTNIAARKGVPLVEFKVEKAIPVRLQQPKPSSGIMPEFAPEIMPSGRPAVTLPGVSTVRPALEVGGIERVDPLVLSNMVSLLEGAQTGGYNIEHAIQDKADGGIFNHSEPRERLEKALENFLTVLLSEREQIPYEQIEKLKKQFVEFLKKNVNLPEKEIMEIWETWPELSDDFSGLTLDSEGLNLSKEFRKERIGIKARQIVNKVINFQLKNVIAFSGRYNFAQTVLCVGETKEQYVGKRTRVVLKDDLEELLAGINKEEARRIGLRLAYEPRWAIGTGLTPTVEEIQATHRFIKDTVNEILSEELDVDYGGSLNEKNCAEILALPDVDGGLIGGAAKVIGKITVIIDAAIKHGQIKGKKLNVGMNWKAEDAKTGLEPVDAFVELFRTKDLSKVQIAIGTPNVAKVRGIMTTLEDEISAVALYSGIVTKSENIGPYTQEVLANWSEGSKDLYQELEKRFGEKTRRGDAYLRLKQGNRYFALAKENAIDKTLMTVTTLDLTDPKTKAEYYAALLEYAYLIATQSKDGIELIEEKGDRLRTYLLSYIKAGEAEKKAAGLGEIKLTLSDNPNRGAARALYMEFKPNRDSLKDQRSVDMYSKEETRRPIARGWSLLVRPHVHPLEVVVKAAHAETETGSTFYMPDGRTAYTLEDKDTEDKSVHRAAAGMSDELYIAKALNMQLEEFRNGLTANRSIYQALGGEAFGNFADYLYVLEKSGKKWALVVGPEFFKSGGTVEVLNKVSQLNRNLKIALYGEKSKLQKLILGNEEVVTADTFDKVLAKLRNLGIASKDTILVASSDDFSGRGITYTLEQEKVRTIIEDDISTIAVAKAIKELVNDKKADEAFSRFYTAVQEEGVIPQQATATKELMLRQLGTIVFSMPDEIKLTQEKSDETKEAREALAEFMDKV